MTRRHVADFSRWPSLSLEGNLIAPAMLSKISAHDAPEQSPEDYSVRKGLTLREEISTAFRVGQSHYKDFADLDTPSQANTMRFAHAFLTETFAFNGTMENDGRASLIFDNRVPVVVVPPAESLDQRSQLLSSDCARSPSLALQDHLSDPNKGTWGLATNGNSIRLMRDNASMTRPAFIEANIEQMFSNEDISSFSTLWLTIHRSRFGLSSHPATECTLEAWRNAGAAEGEVVRDRLSAQVKDALIHIGSGMLEENPKLRRKLESGDVILKEWFNELLRIIYRLIFIMVAEDRNLLHHKEAKSEKVNIYREGYSTRILRKRCISSSFWNNNFDIYEGMKVVFQSLAYGQTELGLPALGGLFDENNLPITGKVKIPNHSFMKSLYKLSWISDKKSSIVPINWKAMETEELGSVYESLLELQPRLSDDSKGLIFASGVSETKGNQRKVTGSYYTPDVLVQELLSTSLDPILDKIERESSCPDKDMLEISVIDPACGSGHFLLAASRRIASRVARLQADGVLSQIDYQRALGDVARNCIYGVDRNPMAVELAKVALWIETMTPGRPLSFLDAKILCGDALLGIFSKKMLDNEIPDCAYRPLIGDSKSVAKYYLMANRYAKMGQKELDLGAKKSRSINDDKLIDRYFELRAMPEETIEHIEMKSKYLSDLRSRKEFVVYRCASNLYMAAFIAKKEEEVSKESSERSVPTSYELQQALNSTEVSPEIISLSNDLCDQNHIFHWWLEFSDKFRDGGFDVVIGNPPWERIELQETEFFSTRDPEIATAPTASIRKKMIKDLKNSENPMRRKIFLEHQFAKRLAEASSTFVRVSEDEGGRFPYTGSGKVNTYALFAELFSQLAKPTGRVGMIVPTGIATDASLSKFFNWLMSTRQLAVVMGFENRVKFFPAVSSGMKFALLTLGRSEPRCRFLFFLTDPEQAKESERNFTLSSEQISIINPNTRTVPAFRSRFDCDLTTDIQKRIPVLVNESKKVIYNPWEVNMSVMYNMSTDSDLFYPIEYFEENEFLRQGTDWNREDKKYVPLFEAKMIHQFDHRWARYCKDNSRWRDSEDSERENFDYEMDPQYWVSETRVLKRLRELNCSRDWIMVWRSISSSAAKRTFIATVLPICAASHSLSVLSSGCAVHLQSCLLANLNSIVLDYVARQKIGGNNVSHVYVKQFPVLPPNYYSEERLKFVSNRVLKLIFTSNAMKPFADDMGFSGSPFMWSSLDREVIRSQLDAFFARAYGLSKDELLFVLDPHCLKGDDYPSETFSVLKSDEEGKYNEYRTKKLILMEWDRMESSGEFTQMDM